MADLGSDSVVVRTKLGPLRVVFTPRGVAAVDLCGSGGRGSSRAAAPDGRAGARPSNQELIRQFQAYAAGKPVRFRYPLDLSAGTAFQQKVWRALQSIPRGQTRSYAWVARKIGTPSAARAVGAACGANPIPVIVPCHRVVASDGSLGGFSGGLALKKRLLKLEGAL